MFTRAEIKEQAKAQLKGKVGILFVCALVASIVPAIVSGIGSAITNSGNVAVGTIVSLAGSLLLTAPLSLGLTMVYLNVTYGEEPQVSTVFEPFKKCYGKAIALFLLFEIFIMLWTLLFVIPGIIMTFAYSQAFFILAENPDMSPMECLKESKRIMKGRKMDLFVLYLSFIPWMLLVCVTFFIAGIWVIPYMTLTFTNFYHRIKEGADQEGNYNNAATDAVTNIIENAADKVEEVSGNVIDKAADAVDGSSEN